MIKRYLTYCFVGLALLTDVRAMAQTAVPMGLEAMCAMGNDELIGTSRYVGLCGAMTAVGGDPTAVKLNPAGLGVYRHNQFSITAEGQFRKFWEQEAIDHGQLYTRWHLSQASYVFALIHPERIAGIVSNNLMLSYAKRSAVLRIVTLNDRSGHRVASEDWIETALDEYGYRNDFNLHYAMNISNRVYWGIGLTLEWLQLRQTQDRWEYVYADKRGLTREYSLRQNAQGNAVGFAGSLGVLFHPIQALRIGLSVESPTVGKMKETDYFDESFRYLTRADMNYDYSSPNMYSRWQMTTPVMASAGLAWQWKRHGLLSVQYDMQYHKLTGFAHTARAGIELVANRHWLFDLGYAYSTLYNRQRLALGVNYAGHWIRVGVAYNFSWCQGTIQDVYYYTPQGLFRANENKIVFTFQWNT